MPGFYLPAASVASVSGEDMNTGRSPHRLSKRTPKATAEEVNNLQANWEFVRKHDRSRTSAESWRLALDTARGNEKACRIYAALARYER